LILVLDGQLAVNGQFSWTGVLWDYTQPLVCTATLIRSDRVLTAASCVSLQQPQAGGVWFGSVDRIEPGEVEREFDTAILHPDYISSGRANQYNIAVAILTQKYDIYHPYIWPIQLPSDNLEYFEDDIGILAGFGAHLDNGVNYYLRWNPFYILSRSQCSGIFPGTENTNILCGQSPTSASCTEDKGAPLFVKVNEIWTLIGVNTGITPCVANTISAFVRVSEYLEFIQSV
jgi:secreted trypsin-like serine protease